MASTMLIKLFALLLALTAVNCLTCHKCNTQDSTLCKWGLASLTFNTEECTSAGVLDNILGPKCYKITAQNKEGQEYIARGCLPPATIGCSAIATTIGWISKQSDSSDSLSNLSCDTCETDKCNSATKITGVTLIALVISGAIFMF